MMFLNKIRYLQFHSHFPVKGKWNEKRDWTSLLWTIENLLNLFVLNSFIVNNLKFQNPEKNITIFVYKSFFDIIGSYKP